MPAPALIGRLTPLVAQFDVAGPLSWAAPHGSGHINDTYALHCAGSRYCMQRINHHVFRNVPQTMENIVRVTRHVRRKVIERGGDPDRETLTIVPAKDGQSWYRDDEGFYWRVYLLIEGASTCDEVGSLAFVREAARAFAQFQHDIADLPGSRLHETIPHFHDTVHRLDHFRRAVAENVRRRAGASQAEIAFVNERASSLGTVVELLADGSLPERITHNDTKLNNAMIDDQTGRGLCVLDLDTVMPGSVLYDFGDAVRLGASTAAEDETDLSLVGLSLERYTELARGYLSQAAAFLTAREISLLAFSCWLMTLECGMRFLTDYLEGDGYFKTHRREHNLDRCRTQFAMVQAMEAHRAEMEDIVSCLVTTARAKVD